MADLNVHIVGGGVAGLAAALGCMEAGLHVTLYEAAPELGGRARSYESAVLGCAIDNGAHAVLRNNESVMRYLALCGGADELTPHGADGLHFHDVRARTDWRLRLPHGLVMASHRPPGVSAFDLLAGARLVMAGKTQTAAVALRASQRAMDTLWEPLCTAALNTPLAEADAATLALVLKRMVWPGGLNQGLLLPRRSLSQTYISPALRYLAQRGAALRTGTPLRDLRAADGRVNALIFDGAAVALAPDDVVVLALPPWAAPLALTGVDTSAFTYAPIVNAHFKLPTPAASRFVGLTGGVGQWLLVRGDVASVTISAADAVAGLDPDALAQSLWAEIAPLLNLPSGSVPPAHVIKERRATLRHTPGLNALRPGIATRFSNLFLAGDWTDSAPQHGLPCTLESAAQSGFACAKRAAELRKQR
ncbi:MAG: FAD-dependent oxidoreductase [Rhodospirillaceae bacterium]|nr:FAD-dependent oxidoreductase [Rhodospirillaceae bacterium]